MKPLDPSKRLQERENSFVSAKHYCKGSMYIVYIILYHLSLHNGTNFFMLKLPITL